MSKTSKRKAVDSSKSNIQSNSKDPKRPSVFERLGTKASNISSSTTSSLSINVSNQDSFCRSWAQTGSCPYGKSCKLSNSHSLISPSKRSSKKDIDSKLGRNEEKRLHSSLARRISPDVNWESWDQTDLEYEDEKALEKRRQLLQRELELQMKKETRKQEPVKRRCSSTSSCTSSSSASTSSSGSTSESSVSTVRRNEAKKKRQSTSSPSESERTSKKTIVKTVHKGSPVRKSSGNKKVSPLRKTIRRKSPSPRKLVSPSRQKSLLSLSGGTSSKKRESPATRRGASLEKKSFGQHRSSSRNRRVRSPKSRPCPRTPESKPMTRTSALPPSLSLTSSRNRSIDRRKDDDRKTSKDDSIRRDRKSDFRDKRDQDEGRRSREKAREVREAAREKERLEALERCRERQREREQLAKEKERAREERERERLKRERERRDRRVSPRERRRPAVVEDKRIDRIFERYERKTGERERSYDRERARDRAIDRVIERKSADRNRDRSRESYDRPYESRRIIQDEKPYNSPYRGNERNRNNYDSERERGAQEVRTNTGYNSAGEADRRPRRDRQTWDNSGGGNYQDSQRDKREWDQRDYRDSSREWDGRSRCRGDEGVDDWSNYNAGGSGGSDWHSTRSHILPISHHEERRSHLNQDISEKEHSINELLKDKDQGDSNKRLSRGSGDELEDVGKRSRLEETSLKDELSDISDEADDILNREDVEEDSLMVEERRTGEEESEVIVNEPSQPNQQLQDEPVSVTKDAVALTDDEHSLVFEEISDDELEEEAKVNKGSSVGDALGVDWASLMTQCRPQRKQQVSSAHTFWSTANIFTRIGVSLNMATPAIHSNIKEKFNLESEKDQLTPVAGLYRAIVEKRQRRAQLVTSTLEHKQALSARSDISVRRQLCGLPVVSLESHHTAGFCQWAV